MTTLIALLPGVYRVELRSTDDTNPAVMLYVTVP